MKLRDRNFRHRWGLRERYFNHIFSDSRNSFLTNKYVNLVYFVQIIQITIIFNVASNARAVLRDRNFYSVINQHRTLVGLIFDNNFLLTECKVRLFY